MIEKMDVEHGSIQESIALYVWRKRQRIQLLNTISVVVANVNPDKAQQALSNLIEEQFPEQQFERAKAVEKALKIMEKERNKVFSVTPRYKTKQTKGLIAKVNKVLKRGS